MPTVTRPPLDKVPLFLRCRACGEPFRAVASFVRPVVVECPCCHHPMRMVPEA
jgi:predicted nucleic acid-binding Zn ribbon protein